jgi:hypothetical protein
MYLPVCEEAAVDPRAICFRFQIRRGEVSFSMA